MRCLISLLVILCYSLTVSAQGRYSGKVMDQHGKPIANVNIRLEKTGQSFKTDKNGIFVIVNVPKPLAVAVSMLGFETQRLLWNDYTDKLEVILKQKEQLLDVVEVNTGYQSFAKERSTASFSQIDSTKLTTRISNNILQKLEYLAPGLQFDNRTGKSVINIRGINTFSDNLMQPLIIVDNFPYSGDIANINPNDVESVTLLKDASAASIWGARAGNGVIVINLKKNSKGYNKMEFTHNLTFGEKQDLFYLRNISSTDFIDVERMLFDKGFYKASLNSVNSRLLVFSPVVQLLYQQSKGLISMEEADRQINSFRNHDYRKELMDNLYRNPIRQQYHLSNDLARDKFTNRFALGYDRNSEQQQASNNQHLTLQTSNRYDFSDQLQLQVGMAWSNQKSTSSPTFPSFPINPLGGKAALYPYAQLKSDDASSLAIPYNYNLSFVQNIPEPQLLDWTYKPLEDYKESQSNSNTKDIVLNATLNYKPFPFLSLSGLYNYENQSVDIEKRNGVNSFYTRDLINRFSQVENGIIKRIVPFGDIMQNNTSRMLSHKARFQASSDFSLQEDWKFNLFAGAEISHASTDTRLNTAYGYDENTMTSINVDPINTYPIYSNLSGNSRIPFYTGFGRTSNRFVSLFGNAAVTYKNRYIANFSARRDASNLFGVKTNDRWNPLWSAGLAWVITNEKFMDKLNWIDLLKFRTTVGHSGNLGGVSTTLPIIYYDNPRNDLETERKASVGELPNPNLKWEDVQMNNFALDFAFLNNRLSGSFDYYLKKSTDLLATEKIDPTLGLYNMRRNVGELKGRGFDLNIGYRQALNKSLKIGVEALFAFSTDKVTKYKGTVSNALFYASAGGRALMPYEGRGLYPVFSYPFKGLDPNTGDPLGWYRGEVSKNYSGMLYDSVQNLNYHGRGLPTYQGSLRPSVQWKGFQASLNLVYKFGYFFQKETINYAALFKSWKGNADFADRWQQPGDEARTSVPSMIYPANASRDDFYANSSMNVLKGDHIRISDIRLGYSFAAKTAHKPIAIAVNGYVNNVGIIWRKNKYGLDPDSYGIPAIRTYGLNINVKY
ncbi:SusC/RagA family TonB-linked outer membrane protein [Sphingobacterium siyangense]|uniref:SusC/RagA family TonB-linked outer membrane protein n=1 Tax=Sphingobacterium siyangense TaxID=459529 RepID=UPI003DA36127